MADVSFVAIIINLLLVFYALYLRSYFQEKGKNLATKQDIEEITRKVETIKTDLDLSKDLTLSFVNEQRQVIMDFYNRIVIALAHMGPNMYENIELNDDKILTEIRSNLNEAYYQYTLAEGKLELLIDNKPILDKLAAIYIKMTQQRLELIKYTAKVREIQVGIRALNLTEIEKAKKFLDDLMDFHRQKFTTILEPQKKMREELFSIKSDFIKLLSKANE